MNGCRGYLVECPQCGAVVDRHGFRGVCAACVERIENNGAIERVKAVETTPAFQQALARAYAEDIRRRTRSMAEI